MKKKLIIPGLALLVTTGLLAMVNSNHWFGSKAPGKNEFPDAKEELSKIYAVYGKADTSFTMKGRIRLFDREQKDSLAEEMPLFYCRQGAAFYGQLGYMQSFFDDGLLVQLDTVNKYIIVSKVEKEAAPVASSGFPLEKFMEDTSAFKIQAAVIDEKSTERVMTIKSELTPEIKSTTIFYDPVTYVIKRAKIEWWKDALVAGEDGNKTWLTVIEYSYPAGRQVPIAEQVKKIITRKNDEVAPAPGYQNYEIRQTY
jgi:hypothetical protein